MSVRAWRRRVVALQATALAACAVVAIAGGGWMWWESAGVTPLEQITTARAEHTSRSLSDGSQVQVAANTALQVQYRRSRRDLTLSHGEALFKVAKDPRRPFTVETPMLQVTAVGTAFDVEAEEARTTVTVMEGAVGVVSRAVSRGGFTSDQVIRVSARQRLVIENGEIRLTALGPSDSLEPDWLVWRREYRREPLREVIADVNRYSRIPIELQDEAVGDREYTGSVQLKDIDSWLLGVAKAFHLSLSVDANGVSLRKKVSNPVPQASLRAS